MVLGFSTSPNQSLRCGPSLRAFLKLHEDAEVDKTCHFAVSSSPRAYLAMIFSLFLVSGDFSEKMSLPSLGCSADDSDRELLADELLQLVKDLVLVAVRDARIVLGLEL
jgi:hypothetical protein